MRYLNKMLANLFLLGGLYILMGCEDDALPIVQSSDQLSSQLAGSWVSNSRSVTVYKRDDNLEADPTGNSWFYYDSSYNETIDHRFVFGLESRPDSALLEVTTFNEDGFEDEQITVNGIWKSGEVSDPEGPFAVTRYFMVLNPDNIHETERGYLRTYTIEELQANTMIVSYSDNNQRDRNSKLYNLTFTKQ